MTDSTEMPPDEFHQDEYDNTSGDVEPDFDAPETNAKMEETNG